MDSNSFARWAVGLALATTVLAIAAKNMVVDLDLFHEMALAREAWESTTPHPMVIPSCPPRRWCSLTAEVSARAGEKSPRGEVDH